MQQNGTPNTELNSLKAVLEKLNPNLALIFGSYVLNPSNARDLDLLVISDIFADLYYQHRHSLLPERFLGKKVDAFCYTSYEFKQLFISTQPFIESIKHKHITLIGEPSEYI